MCSQKRSVKGLSLLEIIISMVIFSMVIVGIVHVFMVGRSYIAHGRSLVSGVELGRVFLEPLQVHVNQTTWDNTSSDNKLLVQDPWLGQKVNINDVEYTPEYNITNVTTGGRELRKVKVTIGWNETSL